MTNDNRPLTPAEIAELRKLEAASAKWPQWHYVSNAEYITTLRTAAPRLLATAEREARLREKCTKIENEINAYLLNGGMFNPELANHGNVRDWLRGIAAALAEEVTEGRDQSARLI